MTWTSDCTSVHRGGDAHSGARALSVSEMLGRVTGCSWNGDSMCQGGNPRFLIRRVGGSKLFLKRVDFYIWDGWLINHQPDGF